MDHLSVLHCCCCQTNRTKSFHNPDNFFDFESFGFLNWSLQQGFDPLDFLDRPEYGHPTAEAHSAFGEQILIPHLEKL